MKKWICIALAVLLCATVCAAQADLLTEWGIPREIAEQTSVLLPHATDGDVRYVRELQREQSGGKEATGWIASVDEVYYDGVTAFVCYTIREIGADAPIGTLGAQSGVYELSEEDEHYVNNRGVGWNQDNLLVNGQKVDMPLTDETFYGSAEPGIVRHYMKIRLDQAGFAVGAAQTLGLPIGSPLHIDGRDLTDEETKTYAEAKKYPDEMGFITVDLNEPKTETKTFEVNRKLGDTTIGTVETTVTPLRVYVNVGLTADPAKVAEQHAKDKETTGWEDVPESFSAGTVNEKWIFGAALVDGEGKPMDDMCGMFTGVMAAGGDVAMFEYNLPVKTNAQGGAAGAGELPEALYLAQMDESGKADMSTAIRVY